MLTTWISKWSGVKWSTDGSLFQLFIWTWVYKKFVSRLLNGKIAVDSTFIGWYECTVHSSVWYWNCQSNRLVSIRLWEIQLKYIPRQINSSVDYYFRDRLRFIRIFSINNFHHVFSSNDCKSWTLCGNSMHNIHRCMAFPRYGSVDVPAFETEKRNAHFNC